jgi:hypothetical protein
MIERSRRLSAWIALLAMTLNALWPLIAEAKPRQDAGLHEVCTAQGIQTVAFDGGAPGEQPAGKKATSHCAFCPVSADRLGLAASSHVNNASLVEGSDAVHIHAGAPLVRAPVHSAARPRAPPVSA